MLVGQLIEASVEIVEQLDQLLGVAFGGEYGEPLNIGEQNAVEMPFHNVHTMSKFGTVHLFAREEDRNGCISGDLKILKI